MSIAHPEFTTFFQVAGALTVANSPIHFVAPYPCEVAYVVASVGTAPTGTGSVTVDLLKNDVSVFVAPNTTKPTIAVTTKTSPIVKAALGVAASTNVIGAGGAQYSPGTNVITPYVNDGAALASLNAGDTLSVGVTAIGGTVAGSDLGVTVGLYRK